LALLLVQLCSTILGRKDKCRPGLTRAPQRLDQLRIRLSYIETSLSDVNHSDAAIGALAVVGLAKPRIGNRGVEYIWAEEVVQCTREKHERIGLFPGVTPRDWIRQAEKYTGLYGYRRYTNRACQLDGKALPMRWAHVVSCREHVIT
jgi:hypothetical protein